MKYLIALCCFWLTIVSSTQESPSRVGTINLPYASGDGGVVGMRVTTDVTVTWENPPADAAGYVFVWKSLWWDKPWFIMGWDTNDDDGVSIPWKVRELLHGVPYGIAFYPDGTFILSEISTLEYFSGKAPPEGICSASYSGGDGLMVMEGIAPTGTETRFLGFLWDYVPVVDEEVLSDGSIWLKIDITSPGVIYDPEEPLPEFGWIPRNYVSLHGDCGFLSLP